MGNFFSFWKNLFSSDLEFKILILGLNDVGKTTIIERIRTGDYEQTVPTIGYQYDELKINNVTLKVWDLSG